MVTTASEIELPFGKDLIPTKVGLPQFGPELKFEPELFRTGPKFGPGFDHFAEPDRKFSSGFREICKLGEPS